MGEAFVFVHCVYFAEHILVYLAMNPADHEKLLMFLWFGMVGISRCGQSV